MDTFFQDFRFTLRSWRRRPGQITIILLTLALGVGANAAIFSFVNALLLRPLPFPDAERMVRVYSVRGNETGKLMPREWEELLRRRNVFEGAAAWYPSQYNLTSDGPPESVPVMMTTGNLFELLGVRLSHGDPWPLNFYQNRHTDIVLGHGLWQRRFGSDPSIVGKSIVMDTSLYQVVGIAPPGFTFPVKSDLYRAANLMSDQNRTVRSVSVVAKLASGVGLQQAQEQLNSIAAAFERDYPDTNHAIRFSIAPLRDSYVGEARPYLLLTLALVALVLLIACANVVSLLLAHAVWRRQEIALRAALGASYARLIRQLLTESLLCGVCGGILGLLAATLAVPAIRKALRYELPDWLNVTLDWRVLAFALAISILAGVIAGLVPAISAARAGLLDPLQQGVRTSAGGAQTRLRSLLVAAELALAFTLLTGAGLLVRSFLSTLGSDMGFSAHGLLTFRCDPPWATYNNVAQTGRFYRLAIDRLEKLPGVRMVAANHSLPLAGNDNYGRPAIVLEGQPPDEQQHNPFVNLQVVSPNYFQVMGIRLLSGRTFSNDDRESTRPVAIISRNLADQLFGRGNLPNRRIRPGGLVKGYEQSGASSLQDAWFTIIGVVDKVRSETLLAGYGMDLYLSNQQQFAGDTYFILKTDAPMSRLAQVIPAAIRDVDLGQSVFDIQPMQDRIEATIWQRRIAGVLSMTFGILAAVLAAAGVYGSLSYSVSRRTREIGIRLAVGAAPASVRRLILAEGLRVAAVGLAAGLGGALALAFSLRGLLQAVNPLDPLTFTAVPVFLLLTALLACYLPARRASKVSPVNALKDA